MLTYSTGDGWCYPLSESAQTVVDAFANALRVARVELVLNSKVLSIHKEGDVFKLPISSGVTLEAEQVIVAAGGKAYPTLGSRGELFASLKSLGHTLNPLFPALAPVACEMKAWQKLLGVRLDAHTSLLENGQQLAETTGNLIFTEWGLNGPAVMDLSHHIANRPGAMLELLLNPLFESEPALRKLMERERYRSTPVRVVLGAALPPKVPPVVLARADFDPQITVDQLNEEQIEKLFRTATTLPFKVTGVRGFEYCQVSAGGVPVSEVDPLNMRSLRVPGLALVGETLDVVGPCGGYNLQFAFSSGALAGMGIPQ